MKKGVWILAVIAMIGVAALVLWDLIFNEGGIYQTGYETGSGIMNGFLGGIFGSDEDFVPADYNPADDGSDSMDLTNPF